MIAIKLEIILFFFLALLVVAQCFLQPQIRRTRGIQALGASFGGHRWKELDLLRDRSWKQPTVMPHLGDNHLELRDGFDAKYMAEFNLRVGTCMETLKHQLPLLFYISNMDYSIYANLITIADGNRNKLVIQRSFYKGAVESLRMAASLSSIYPSMNVKKIEYISDCRTIQCLVDVVLPDSMRVDGQASTHFLLLLEALLTCLLL
jgi:hypothetical protein